MTRFPENFGLRHVVLWLLLLAALLAVAAYFTMLTGFTSFDDEGTLMLTVQQNLSGKLLYRDVYSIYGPLYYFYNFLTRTLTSTPVTHDVTRVSSIFPWMLCIILSAGIVLRLTRSLVMAAAGLYLVSKTLSFFRLEPGHTHELTLVLLIALVASPLWKPLARRRRLLMTVLGCLAGALLLVKVNIGIFVLAALVLALLVHMAPAPLGRYFASAIGVGCILLPALLMRRHLDASWAQAYCGIATASVAASVFCLLRCRRNGGASFSDAIWLAAGCASIVAVAMAALAIQGISLSLVFDSLVQVPSRVMVQSRNWYFAPQFSPLWIVWAAIGLGAAMVTAGRRPAADGRLDRWILLLKLAFTAASIAAVGLHIDLLPCLGPFAWVVLFNPDPAERDAQQFPRSVLCAVAIIQTLYGYPVYGSQGQFIQVLLVLLAVVCAGDSLVALMDWRTPAWLARRGPALATLALTVIAALALRMDFARYDVYRDGQPLDLPGAHRIRVDAAQKKELTTLVSGMKESCDVFEGFPGLPSLNFWTGMQPVTGFNLQCWMLYFSPVQQQRVIQALSTHPRACMVYNPVLAAAWNPGGQQDFESLPLVQYMRQSFRPVMSSGDYQLLIRNERRER